MKICEYCGKEHDGSYGSGRFCCARCARKFANRFVDEDGRKRQVQALLDPVNRQKTAETRKRKSEERKKLGLDKPRDPRSTLLPSLRKGTYTSKIGLLGELRTMEEFEKHGVSVYVPISHDSEVDMIAEINGEFKKIQVKSSTRSDGDRCSFGLQSSNTRYRKDGKLNGRKKSYSPDEIDYFSLYDYNDDEVYLLKNDHEQTTITLRSSPMKNPNQNGPNYKEDYRIDKILDLICRNIDSDDIIDVDDYEIIDEDE